MGFNPNPTLLVAFTTFILLFVMSFVPDIDVHGGRPRGVLDRHHRQTPTTASPDLKLGSRYNYRRIELEMPKDDEEMSSSGNVESLADSGFLDAGENSREFETMRKRAEFAYEEIRRTAVEATEAKEEREEFSDRKQVCYGPRSQWNDEDLREEVRLAEKVDLAKARLQRRFMLLPRAIPKARKVLDFDREDGGERVPADWSALSKHELRRIFPNLYGERKEPQDRPMSSTKLRNYIAQRVRNVPKIARVSPMSSKHARMCRKDVSGGVQEPQDRPMSSTNIRKNVASRIWSRAEIAQHFSTILERAKEDRAKSETSTLLTTYLKMANNISQSG